MKSDAIKQGLEKLFERNSIDHDKLCQRIKDQANCLFQSVKSVDDHGVNQIHTSTALLVQINARMKYCIEMLRIVRDLDSPFSTDLDDNLDDKKSDNNFIRMHYSKTADSIELEEINTQLHILINQKIEEKNQ